MLLDHYAQAHPDILGAGRAWYPAARALCEEIGGDQVPVETVARVMSILSARTSWKWNVRWTRMVVDAFIAGEACPPVSTKANRMKAWDELHGRRAFRGPKVEAFARAILGDEQAVVIDSWVLRSVGLKYTAKVTPHRQRWITAAYAQAAEEVKESPRNMQAIVWCAVRGASE